MKEEECFPELEKPLGPQMKYFVGNSRSGMGTQENNCDISFLIGPTYTSVNFINNSKLKIECNGLKISAKDFTTARVKKANCYVSVFENNDLKITLTDFALWGTKDAIRLISAENMTRDQLEVSVDFTLTTGLKILDGHIRPAVVCKKGKDKLFCWTELDIADWLDRKMEVYFTGIQNFEIEGDSIKYSRNITLPSGGKSEAAIVFAFRESYKDPVEQIDIKEVKSRLKENIKTWELWCDSADIGGLPDSVYKDIIISNLIMIKSCQSFDGGFMACPFQYCFSYFRDSHGGLRGLYKAGYHLEIRSFLEWAHRIYDAHGENFNSCAMGADIFQNLGVSQENLASESPSLFCIIAGYYHELTGDMDFIKEIMPSLEKAVMSQVGYIEKNNGHLRFNGDETEKYVPKKDGDMYNFTPDFLKDDFSCSSMILFLAAADFFLMIKDDEKVENAAEKVKDTLLKEYTDEKGILRWQKGPVMRNYLMTNYNLFPIWLDVKLPEGITEKNAREMEKYISPETGYLPISPGVTEGFTGHTLALALDAFIKTGSPKQHEMFEKLSKLTDRYGTFSEFYGPGGVSNTHNMNIFSSGINIASMIDYMSKNKERITKNEKHETYR